MSSGLPRVRTMTALRALATRLINLGAGSQSVDADHAYTHAATLLQRMAHDIEEASDDPTPAVVEQRNS